MSIAIERKGGVTCVSWPIDLYTNTVKKSLNFQITSYQNFQVHSRVPSYEMSWTVNNPSVWERRGFDPRYSQKIRFALKKFPPRANLVDFNEEKDAIPDCYLQPQAVWVTVDGGQFQVFFKLTKIMLNKVECVNIHSTNIPSWESEPVTFTPQDKERFTFKFYLQFKTLCFNQMNTIVEQTTNYLFRQQTKCDVHFRFRRTNEKIGAHRNMLSARSPVFAAMFNHDMQESKTGEVVIHDIEKDIFYQLLHFIYSGRTSDPLTEISAQQLLVAADKYNIQDLKDECATFLLPYVNEVTAQKLFEVSDKFQVEILKEECEHILLLDIQMINVLYMIIWAHLHSARKVKEAALNFARANSKALLKSDYYEKMMHEYPDICLEVTRRMTL